MGKTYREKLTKDLGLCKAANSVSMGELGVCEHPDCSETITFSPDFMWSGKRCSSCLSRGRGESRFIPAVKMLVSEACRIAELKRARYNLGDSISSITTVCDSLDCAVVNPPQHAAGSICPYCSRGRVMQTLRGLQNTNYAFGEWMLEFTDRKPGVPSVSAPSTPKVVEWPSGPHVDLIKRRLKNFSSSARGICLSDNCTHASCGSFVSLPSNVGTPCGDDATSLRVNVPIAAALDKGVPLAQAIDKWRELNYDEGAYKDWLMTQQNPSYVVQATNKFAKAPARTQGVCLNSAHSSKADCANRTEVPVGVGMRCNACRDGCGFMVNIAIAEAMDMGIPEREACEKWNALVRASNAVDASVDFAKWVKQRTTACQTMYQRKHASAAHKKWYCCVTLPGTAGDPDCPGWDDNPSVLATNCHLCAGIIADEPLAVAFDKLLPRGVSADTIMRMRRQTATTAFENWIVAQLAEGSTDANKAKFAEAVEQMVNSGAASFAAPSTKPEEANMAAENKVEQSKIEQVYNKVVKTAKKDAGSAAWRLAATQITEIARPMLIAALCKDVPETDSYRKAIAEFFNTPAGDAFFRGFIGISLPFVPGIDGPLSENLAEEFRVSAMEKGGNVIAAHIVGPIVNVLSVAISQSSAMKALQAQAAELPDSNGVTARVNFADATGAESTKA